jgi:hypothetical protein
MMLQEYIKYNYMFGTVNVKQKATIFFIIASYVYFVKDMTSYNHTPNIDTAQHTSYSFVFYRHY